MGFAGLYETYCDKTGGEIDTACIIVRPANRLVSAVHDRMPAILERADFSAWLDCDHVDADEALALLTPTPEDALELVEIGPARQPSRQRRRGRAGAARRADPRRASRAGRTARTGAAAGAGPVLAERICPRRPNQRSRRNLPAKESPPSRRGRATRSPDADGRHRCPWPGEDPLYVAYHDEEWGVPEYDDRALFEKLVLDGFQAGLSWITILRKRPAFRAAFDGFDPEKIARWDDAKKAALMQDAGIVRNRAKIEATPALARIWLDLMEKDGFAQASLELRRRQADPERTQEPLRHSRRDGACARHREGPRARAARNFVGPTIVYAFMQATGMVNDHLATCWRCEECRALARDNPFGRAEMMTERGGRAPGSACCRGAGST